MSHNENRSESLGKLVSKLRTTKGISQEKLGNALGYSRRQICRIEAGEGDVSREFIALLSNYFNVDIEQYISISKKFTDSSSYSDYVQLRKAIEDLDLIKIEILYDKLNNNPDYNKGENYQFLYYSEGILLTYKEKKYTESNISCFNALDVFNHADYKKSLEEGILTEISYATLFLIQYNYDQLGENDLFSELAFLLVDHFEKLVFNDPIPVKSDMYYMKKYYVISLSNLSHSYYVSGKYSKSLELTARSISMSNEFGISSLLHYLTRFKFEIYYKMKDYENAKLCYAIFKNTCMSIGKMKYFNDSQDEIRSICNLLFED